MHLRSRLRRGGIGRAAAPETLVKRQALHHRPAAGRLGRHGCVGLSVGSSIPSHPANAETSSRPQATTHRDRKTLKRRPCAICAVAGHGSPRSLRALTGRAPAIHLCPRSGRRLSSRSCHGADARHRRDDDFGRLGPARRPTRSSRPIGVALLIRRREAQRSAGCLVRTHCTRAGRGERRRRRASPGSAMNPNTCASTSVSAQDTISSRPASSRVSRTGSRNSNAPATRRSSPWPSGRPDGPNRTRDRVTPASARRLEVAAEQTIDLVENGVCLDEVVQTVTKVEQDADRSAMGVAYRLERRHEPGLRLDVEEGSAQPLVVTPAWRAVLPRAAATRGSRTRARPPATAPASERRASAIRWKQWGAATMPAFVVPSAWRHRRTDPPATRCSLRRRSLRHVDVRLRRSWDAGSPTSTIAPNHARCTYNPMSHKVQPYSVARRP